MNVNLKNRIILLSAFGAITAWALFSGYDQIFSRFLPYDDEGYLMMTVRQFLDGNALYDGIYTQYGPAYYLYQWLSHTLSGLPVTHHVTRLTTLLIWTLTALLGGVLCWRLTASKLLSAISYILTFVILSRTVSEPGHPQEICGLLVILLILTLTKSNAAPLSDWRLSTFAVVLAILTLIKINLGVFAGFGSAIAFAAFSGGERRTAFYVLTALATAFPFLLFGKYFGFGWFGVCASVAAMIISAVISDFPRERKSEIFRRHFLLMIGAFAATCCSVVLFIILKGTTLKALLQGVFLQNLKFGDDFVQISPLQVYAAMWSVVVLAAAVSLAVLRRRNPEKSDLYVNALKIGFGYFVLIFSLIGYGDYLNSLVLLFFAPPLLWLVIAGFNAGGGDSSGGNLLVRYLLAFVGVMLCLQIFPIAGTQTAYAVFLLPVTGAVCVSDGLRHLSGAVPDQFENRYLPAAIKLAAAAAAVVFCAYFFYGGRTDYDAQTPLPFSGAEQIRLPEKEAAMYRFLIENLRSNCDNFLTMPGVFSLNFWSEISPPTSLNATAWTSLLDASQQTKIVESLRKYRRVCAVYNPVMTEAITRNRILTELPLAKYVFENLKTAGEVGGNRLMTADGDPAKLIYAAALDRNLHNLITFALPQKDFAGTIADAKIFDAEQSRIIADSRVSPPESAPETPPICSLKPDENRLLRCAVSFDAKNLPPNRDLILRLYSDSGELLGSLPFLETP